MKRLLPVVAGVAALALVAGGGWWVQRQFTAARAEQARLVAHLGETEGHLATLREEHERLRQTHQTLQQQQTDAQAELQRLTTTQALLTTQLQAATQDKEAAAGELARAQQASDRQQQELETVQQQIAELTHQREDSVAQRRDLEAQLSRIKDEQAMAARRQEELASVIRARQQEAEQLREKIADVSGAYDRLLAAQLMTPAGRKAIQAQVGGIEEPPLPLSERRRQARLHGDLAHAYWALDHFEKAAQELELSLRMVDDPAVHAKLVILYSRFLGNPMRASGHLVKAKGARLLSEVPLAKAHQLPRDSTRLVHEYLYDR